MTVKLAKFFNNSSSVTAAHTPPPLPPPNNKTSNTNQYYNSMGYQQTIYDPYMDDDNLSMYSTSTSIMTSRDHPYNNSQRPLLADRKPQLLNKKKIQPQIVSKSNLQQHHQQLQHQQQSFYQQESSKSYISPYVQQQKRDSAKGLHGFNDFDILSQQYNQHLQSPHIGYPYGSPPSPTSVNASDFTFDPIPTAPFHSSPSASLSLASSSMPKVCTTAKLTSTPSPQTARYANIKSINNTSSLYPPTVSTKILSPIYSRHDYNNYESCSNNGNEFIGKPSRFEDDFCTRRNVEFNKSNSPLPTNKHANDIIESKSNSKAGPFLFDPINAQKYSHGYNSNLAKSGGRGFYDSIDNVDESVINGKEIHGKYAVSSGQTTMQSSSDTSSSSRDSKATKGLKALLKKRKSNKKANAKESKENSHEKSEETLKAGHSKIPTIKCVVVGDGAVGKTNLILSYLENRFNTEHIPTASDIYNADVTVNDSPVHLTLCDTAGQDTLDPLRELCYPDSDVFLLCFSVTKPETFQAIKTKWAPKFAKTKAALILVGTQSDLRTNKSVLNKLQTNGEKPISSDDAWDLATTIGAKYIETSSATQDKVKEVFDTAIWEGLLPSTLPPTPKSFWRKLFCLG